MRAVFAELGWQEADLAFKRKSDGNKVALARQLRAETAVSLKWIAARFQMGTWSHVSNLLRRKSVKSEDWACIDFADSE